MNTEEQKDLVQRQIIDLVKDIKQQQKVMEFLYGKPIKYFIGCDISKDNQRLFVHLLEREAPFMSFNDGVDWWLDFDKHYDTDKVNDCLTSLACVLSDLEAGL